MNITFIPTCDKKMCNNASTHVRSRVMAKGNIKRAYYCDEHKRDGDVNIIAHPIAATPNLLASCEELVKAMNDYSMAVEEDPPYKHREMMRRANAAIAAAKRNDSTY